MTENDDASADRMLRLRTAFGLTQREFCIKFGMTIPQWSSYENGRPVSRMAALSLVEQIPGLTIDWIWLGRIDGLSPDLARQLGEPALLQ